MTPERATHARQLMQAALARPSFERTAFLTQVCGTDVDLRREVEVLLRTADAQTSMAPPTVEGVLRRIGRYEIERELGAGAMGVVYLGRDTLLGRRVALKSVLPSNADADKQVWFRDRLIREARAAAALSHPNIAAMHDLLEEKGVSYVVMEYVDGTTVAAAVGAVSPQRRPHPQWVMNVVRQAAAGLDYAHQRGIVHRDIKPANLLIDTAGAVKIVDFGIAKILDSNTQATQGLVMGTVEYMSPEQIRAEALTGAADQFSLAAMTYVLLTGQQLFPGVDSLTSLMYKNCYEQPVPATRANPALPARVDAVLERALAKTAADRYPSCREFVAALEDALNATVVAPAPLPASPAAAVARPAGSKAPRIAGAALAAVLVAAGGVGAYLWSSKKSDAPAPKQPSVAAQTPVTPPVSTAGKAPAPPAGHKPPAEVKPVAQKPAAEPKPPGGAPHADASYRGPTEGQMVWTGRLEPGSTLRLDNSVNVTGARLPGVPVEVEVVPAVLEIAAAPSRTDHWGAVSIKNSTARPQTLIILKWKVSR